MWDRDGKASDYSEPAWFEMGLLEPSDFGGKWIGLAGEKAAAVSPLLRKEFVVGGPVKRARLYAAGIGWSEYYLNGARIGDNVLDPTATDYDKRILYVTHDVTGQIRPGTNALSVMLGNGWYSEPGGPNYGDSPRLLLQLIIELADGTVKRIISDPSWRATGGPILKNDFYGGELYDARLEKDGWLEPGYEDASWPAAALKDSPRRTPGSPVGRTDQDQPGSQTGRIDQSQAGSLCLRFRPVLRRMGPSAGQGAGRDQGRAALRLSCFSRRGHGRVEGRYRS